MRGVDARRVGVALTGALVVAACSSVDDPRGLARPPTEATSRAGAPTSDGLVTVPPVPTPASSTSTGSLPATSSSTISSPATSTSTIPTIPNSASAEILRQQRLYGRPDPLGALSIANGVPPTLLPPGVHTTDVLGIAVTLRLDDWWRLDEEQPGSFVLNRTDAAVGDLLPVISFERPVGLVEPRRVADENLLPGEFPFPPDDLRSWFDEVPQIEVLATGDAVAGDRTGRWYDIDVDPGAGPTLGECSPGECVHTWWSGASHTTVARDLEALRYYEFPDPSGPIFVLVAAVDDEFEDWVDRADRLIRSATFGPSAPHPVPDDLSVGMIRAHAAGQESRFVSFPGVVITPLAVRFSVQQPGKLRFEPWIRNSTAHLVDAAIVRPLQDSGGNPLHSLDDVVAVLEASPLTRHADETVFDTAAAVFSGVVDGPIFRRVEVDPDHRPDFAYWPDFGHLHAWAFDSPIGPLLIAAEAESEIYLDTAKAQATELVAQVRFECPTDGCVRDDGGVTSACATDSCTQSDESVG